MRSTCFPSEVEHHLAYYVYAYVDPQSDEVFYVGKGVGSRAFYHLDDPGETEKTRRIVAIRASGREPRIDILVYGLSEKEALRVEAVCIDLVGVNRLTNLVTGHGSEWGGRQSVAEIMDQFCARPVAVNDPAIAINLNRTFQYGMEPEDLYDATRGWWKVSESRVQKARYALAIFRNVVKEVYEISKWLPAGSTQFTRRVFQPEVYTGRFEFTGALAPPEVREKYVGRRVVMTGQSPIQYLNCPQKAAGG